MKERPATKMFTYPTGFGPSHVPMIALVFEGERVSPYAEMRRHSAVGEWSASFTALTEGASCDGVRIRIGAFAIETPKPVLRRKYWKGDVLNINYAGRLVWDHEP